MNNQAITPIWEVRAFLMCATHGEYLGSENLLWGLVVANH